MGRLSTIGLMGWSICAAASIALTSQAAAAQRSIALQSFRPQHPEFSWLKRFLALRGYQPGTLARGSNQLSLQIQTPSLVRLQQGPFTRRYTLPTSAKTPQVRARLMVMYVSLFLGDLRAGRLPRQATAPLRPKPLAPAPRPAPPNPRQVPKRRRVRKVRPRKGPSRLLQKPRPTQPQRRMVARAAAPLPVPRARIVPRRRLLPPRVAPSKRLIPPRRRSVPKARLVPKRRAAARVALGIARRLPPSKKARIWGDVLSLDLGISGGFRWSNFERLMGGGQLLFGFNVWRWTLRAELAFETYYLTREARTIALMRPAFWVGWQVPLGPVERWLRLRLLLGTGAEFFIREAPTNYTESLEWGVLAGVQLHYWFTRRWSLFLRPSVLVLPGGFSPLVGAQVSFTPPVQIGLLLGLQVRL